MHVYMFNLITRHEIESILKVNEEEIPNESGKETNLKKQKKKKPFIS